MLALEKSARVKVLIDILATRAHFPLDKDLLKVQGFLAEKGEELMEAARKPDVKGVLKLGKELLDFLPQLEKWKKDRIWEEVVFHLQQELVDLQRIPRSWIYHYPLNVVYGD